MQWRVISIEEERRGGGLPREKGRGVWAGDPIGSMLREDSIKNHDGAALAIGGYRVD
jgi:hypothetical protein